METENSKSAIRRSMLRQRSRLPDAAVRSAAERLPAVLADLLDHCCPLAPERRSLHIAVYAAMRNELDLSCCWHLLLSRPAILYFPAVTPGGLVFGRLPDGQLPQAFLGPGVFSVPEPPSGSLSPLPDLDLVLVPGLAFDRSGNRIGWGKAYYDTLLAKLPQRTIRVGVGYTFQVLAPLPADPHDQPLQALLTPEGWFFCETDRPD